jgi:hypothetical protein
MSLSRFCEWVVVAADVHLVCVQDMSSSFLLFSSLSMHLWCGIISSTVSFVVFSSSLCSFECGMFGVRVVWLRYCRVEMAVPSYIVR